MSRLTIVVCLPLILAAACAPRPRVVDMPSAPDLQGHAMEGIASWYGKKFHGRRTANGEIYDMHILTAAHKTLPFHTLVRVTRLDENRSVVVRINDRGPFVAGRIIDLSYAAARRLGIAETGTAPVRLQPVSATVSLQPPVERGLRVQAGAFSLPENAAALAQRLHDHFNCAFSVEKDDGLHRVLSPLLSRDSAEELCRRLRTAGIEAFVREAF